MRRTDAQGREGLGYTYIVNNIAAAAVLKLIKEDLAEPILASAQIQLKPSGKSCDGTLILKVAAD